MTRTLVKAKKVLTLIEEHPGIDNGALIAEDGIIREVGEHTQLAKKGPFDEEVGSLEKDIMMPGLVNAHHHIGRYFRDGLTDGPLEVWLLKVRELFRLTLTPEESYYSALWSGYELIRSGITAAIEFHSDDPGPDSANWQAAIRAYSDLGLKVAFCPAAADQNRYIYLDDDEFMKLVPKKVAQEMLNRGRAFSWEDYFQRWKGIYERFHSSKGHIKVFLGPIGVQWCSDELLNKIKAAAREFATGIQLHLLETRYQRKYGLKRWGKSLVGHLKELNFLGPEVSCAHCVWLDQEDFKIMAQSGATAVHNPSSNLRLGSGISPVALMAEAGVRLAFGLDGMGLNDDSDIFADMRLAMYLQHRPGHDSVGLSPRQLLKMVGQGGAGAMMMSDRFGTLEPGKDADLVLLNGERILGHPYQNADTGLEEVLLQRALSQDVKTVLIAGKVVMKNGEVAGMNVDEAKARLEEVCQRRREKVKKELPDFAELERAVREFYRRWDEEDPSLTKSQYKYNLL